MPRTNAVFERAVTAALAARHVQTPASEVDLSHTSGGDFAKLMAEATRRGVSDASADLPEMRKTALVALYCVRYRGFHADALFAAYRAGRQHVATMGQDLGR